MSSAYLISRVWGITGLMSLTIMENNTGPRTVPWGTPLLMLRKLVTTPSTTTLCWRSHRKLIIQFLMYGLMSYDPIFLQRTRWETESKALLKSNEKTLTRSASLSSCKILALDEGHSCVVPHYKRIGQVQSLT